MSVDIIGVHLTHCCKWCGCKYGDLNCPVASGQYEALYECEECLNHKFNLIEELKSISPNDLEYVLDEINKWIET